MTRHAFTLLLTLVCATFIAQAQIHISGNLSGALLDTTYIVDGNVTIMLNDSLMIPPGAELLFSGNYYFYVHGYLYAAGTAQDSIYFKPQADSLAWASLIFYSDAADTCILSYCYFTGARASAMNIYQVDPIISHCTFTGNQANWGGGIYCSFANPTISECVVTDNWCVNNGGGIYCTHASPLITDCIVSGNTSNQGGSGSGRGGGGIAANHDSDPIIQNCVISNNHCYEHGGGISINDISDATVLNCTIENNTADSTGGGISVSNYSNVLISNCTIGGNSTARDGGGICALNEDTLQINDCHIYSNTADWSGGGVYCTNSSPDISNCLFAENTCEGYGGGIGCWEQCHLMLTYSLFVDNMAFIGGGVQCFDSTSAVIENCGFYGNVAQGTYSSSGGGVSCLENCNLEISNCVLQDNNCWWRGGGIDCETSPATIRNCAIVRNHGSDGGGIYCYNSPGSVIENCTLVGNISPEGGGFNGYATMLHMIIWDNYPAQIFGSPEITYSDVMGGYPGTGNIDLYPAFIDNAWLDYRLSLGSPCIDTGNPDPQYNDPDGTIADMGAFFFDQSRPVRVLLTPHDAPLILPAAGGSFDFTIRITNIEAVGNPATVWCDITLPDGRIYGPTIGPVALNVAPQFTIARDRTQNVPSWAPTGQYSYNAYAVSGADTSMDSFGFLKLGSAGAEGDGAWWNSGASLADEEYSLNSSAEMPATFELSAPYPNPFNASTMLTFTLPQAGMVKLEVFDVHGRVVGAIHELPLPARMHTIPINGSDLPSGLYFARLESEGHSTVQKLVLLK
ncbi:MAG: right-handed parallel beta-helix repeat-containing protein [bacterium]